MQSPMETENPEEEWDPIDDVPQNLRNNGSNYVEWVWSLLDVGIEPGGDESLSALTTDSGRPLLTREAAEYLDNRMVVARAAAANDGHRFDDVILCCRAPEVDGNAIAADLLGMYRANRTAAVARARSLGKICDVAEEFCPAAIYLKFDLSKDVTLPSAIRDALNGPIEPA
jgi:hypothetical protein